MDARIEKLFEPITIGGVEFPNRICWSAHSTHLGVDGLPSDRQVAYYEERARGGAGWIVVGGVVARAGDLWEQGFNVLSDKRAIPGFQRLTEAVHRHGSKASVQISHFGLGVPPNRPVPGPVYSPSNLPTALEGEIPKRVDEGDMEMFLDAQVKSVEVAVEGGFDGIELLWSFDTSIEQAFLSPRFNDREDEYGGSLDNRLKFPLRMIKAAREALGGRAVLGLKIVGDEMVDGGLGQEDIKQICRRIDELKLVDYFHICLGTRSNYQLMIPEMSYPAGFAAYLAAGVREVVSVPVVAVKRFDDPLLAGQVILDGEADVIAMARALIADPELPNKARVAELDTIRQCTSSNQECSRRAEEHIKLPMRCIQNPAVGFESTLGTQTLQPAEQRKRIIVIGGGPGGMRAAKVAAQRGHDVELYEAGDRLGGQVQSILQVNGRGGYESVIRYLEGEVQRRGVKVRLGEKATAEQIIAAKPDAVVVATGALPLKTGYSASTPAIKTMPGVDQDHVMTVDEVFAHPERLGQEVVLIDEFGQYEGQLTAEFIGQQGKHVTFVTRQAVAGAKVDGLSLADYATRLAEQGMTTHPNTGASAIDGHVVRATDLNGQDVEFPADTVVLSMGKLPNESLFLELSKALPEVHRVGDCVAPRMITDAIYEGNEAARAI
ncbi:FAD-dependent oxidoreductase [Streptomyces sp. BH106]|uniref:oxidoreductase n=1 Tax=Streptomyces sp. BH106 TaxID=3410409 RepID=UPI003CF3489E